MKKFAVHIVLFVLLPVLVVFCLFNTKVGLFQNSAAPVYQLLTTVDTIQLKTRTLLLGDSVCREFFEEKKNDEVYCLCENQSYEVAGNYLILKRLLARKANFKRLFLVVNPRTLTAALNQKYSYNYFVKPFRNYLSDLNSDDLSYIESNFPTRDVLKYRFSNFELPNAYDIYQNDYQDSLGISKMNRNYIAKIAAICAANDIEFELISPPLPSSTAKYLEKFDANTRNEFSTYFESIKFYDSSLSTDGLHHKNSDRFIKENKITLDSLLGY